MIAQQSNDVVTHNASMSGMSKTLITLLSLFLVLTMAASAVDVTGKWVAQVAGRNGQTREQTFNFKADGANLTGTVSGRQSDTAITNGKIDGDKISFVVKTDRGGNTIEQKYSGTLSGDELKMKREGGQGAATEFTAKRAK